MAKIKTTTIATVALLLLGAFAAVQSIQTNVFAEVIKEHDTIVVEIKSLEAPYYAPNELVVPKGSKIKFINTNIAAHTATSTNSALDETSPDADGRFDTGLLASGKSVVIELNEEGEYNYFCQFHPWMRGKVVVTSA